MGKRSDKKAALESGEVANTTREPVGDDPPKSRLVVRAEPVPEPPAPAAAKAAPVKPARQLARISLRQFLTMAPEKGDQQAGFKHFAGKNLRNLKLTMPEWRKEWDAFQNRPIGKQ